MGARASRWYLDFILDCDADPTGVADVAPSINAANAILTALAASSVPADTLVQQTLELFVPPGLFAIRSDSTTWDFNGKGTTFTLRGVEDASLFVFYNQHNGFIISNAESIHVSDLGFVGGMLNTPDSGRVLDLNALVLGSVERCHFFNLEVSSFVVQLQGESWAWRDNQIAQCCCTNAATACVYSNYVASLIVENSTFLDVGHMNGFLGTGKTSLGNTCWLRHDGSGTTGQGGQVRLIKIQGCEFDEGVYTALTIHGGNSTTQVIPYVKLEGNLFNPSALTNTAANIDIADVVRLDVDGMISSGFTNFNPTFAKLARVNHARFEKLTTNPANMNQIITADNGCGIVEVYDVSGPIVVQSLARSTVSNSMNSCGRVYVDATGSDTTGNGAVDAPFATIDAAITSIVNAATVLSANVPSVVHVSEGTFASPSALPGYVTVMGENVSDTVLTGAVGLSASFVSTGKVVLAALQLADAQAINFGAINGPLLSLIHVQVDDTFSVQGGSAGYTCFLTDSNFAGNVTIQDAVTFFILGSGFLVPATFKAVGFDVGIDDLGSAYESSLTLNAGAGRTLTMTAEHNVTGPLTRTGAGTVVYDGNETVQCGTVDTQTGIVRRFQVVAETLLAAAQTVDTLYQPPASHGAKVTASWSAVDRTANLLYIASTDFAIYNNGGVLSAHGAAVPYGGTGDAALNTSAVTVSISGANTLEMTMTPPAGYANNLDWNVDLAVEEN